MPRFIAQEARRYACMPIRALYLYAEPIVQPMLYWNSSCAILRHPANLRVERTSCYYFCLWRLRGESRVPHSTTTTFLNSAGAGASIAVTPGSVGGPNQHQGEKQSVIVCVIVGDVPNSGYVHVAVHARTCMPTSQH